MPGCDAADNKPKIIVVCGPTASGKTGLAVALALALGGEVISADSMQIYKSMAIATAQPTAAEMRGVPHHLIGFAEADEPFSVSNYTALAQPAIHTVIQNGHVPIVCGGTGLYIRALADGIAFDQSAGQDLAYRAELRKIAETEGAETLMNLLKAADPARAAELHPNNLNRVIRALEICRLSGKTMSEVMKESLTPPNYRALKIGLTFEDRALLYARINARVDAMMAQGLLEEARLYFAHNGADSTSAQAIGYKELKPYLDGEQTLETCVEKLKQATRNYAKKQLTWFGKDTSIHWLKADKTAENGDLLTQSLNLWREFNENAV
jgi:tRNA dimethylallyltransferase